MKPKLKLILIIIIAFLLCAMLPAGDDNVARPDVSFTLTPVTYAYPAPYYPPQISTAYPIEATATAMPTATWVIPTAPPE